MDPQGHRCDDMKLGCYAAQGEVILLSIKTIRALDGGTLHKEVVLASPNLNRMLQQAIGRQDQELEERLERAMLSTQKLVAVGEALNGTLAAPLQAAVGSAR